MRFYILFGFILTVLCLTGFSSNVMGAQQSSLSPTNGYVTYHFTVNSSNSPSQSFIVNETVRSVDGNGMAQISFVLTGGGRHVNYNRMVNTSRVPEVFPYLVGLNNQSFSYSIYSLSVNAFVTRTGTTTITFNGRTYQGQNYDVSLVATNSSEVSSTHVVTGTVETMPSGLVYSIQVHADGQFSLNIQLLATDLPLTNIQQTSSNTIFGFALVGLGLVGAAALAIPSLFAIVKVKKTRPEPSISVRQVDQDQESMSEKKPEYWVD